MPPIGFFPREEYDRRIGKARELMRRHGIDALFVSNPENGTYYSGAAGFDPTYLSDIRIPMPLLVVIPREAEPVVVMHNLFVDFENQAGAVDDVRTYYEVGPREKPQFVQKIKEVFSERGLQGGVIGAELGYEQRFGISYEEYQMILEATRPAKFIDASNIFRELRMVKSSREIEYLRTASMIQARAFQTCSETVKEGMTEQDVHRILWNAVVKEGGQPRWNSTSSGPTEHAGPRPATDKKLRKGEVLFIDNGITYGGYHSDISRIWTIGKASERQAKAHRVVTRALSKTIDAMRPGVRITRILEVCRREFEEAGYGDSVGVTSASKIGHGIGLVMSEGPHLAPYDDRPLEAGMVFAIEPTLRTEDGLFNIEHDVLVTEGGSEILSEFTLDLLQI